MNMCYYAFSLGETGSLDKHAKWFPKKLRAKEIRVERGHNIMIWQVMCEIPYTNFNVCVLLQKCIILRKMVLNQYTQFIFKYTIHNN